MKVCVNRDECIGDSICQDVCPEVFEVRDDGLAYLLIEGDVPANLEAKVQEAADACPTSAIEIS